MTVINKENILNPEKYVSESKMTKEVLQQALADALKKIDKLWDDVHGNCASSASKNNIYLEKDIYDCGDWNPGFTTGLLWLAYEASGDEKYKQRAMSQIDAFYRKIKDKSNVNHHDMGFLFIPSCVAAYKITGDLKAKETAIMAAEHLLSRYIEEGGYIQAWGSVGTQRRLIIDCMNNIPLLYWAAQETGDNNYYDKAYSHATVTLNNIIRPDASTHHTFYFNEDGTPDRGVTAQGFSDTSCWARGQAWIISGLPLTYKYTKMEGIPSLFEKVTNYYLNRLPNDFVPFWDLVFSDGSIEPRDSSSAAIAVCGMLEMLPYIDDEETKKIYSGAVDKTMYSLYKNYSTKDTPESNGLLLHAVYAKPKNLGVDECNIWGCYYYMEALIRLLKPDWKVYW